MIRKAKKDDIARLQQIRSSVRENELRDPSRVTTDDYAWFIANPGIFVWDEGDCILGFAAGDPRDGSVWALFVDPACEGRGIGRALFAKVIDVLNASQCNRIWLTTSPQTRAEQFYRNAGWVATGTRNDELVFEQPAAKK